MEPLASNIKYLRKRRGQTQQELSEALGYNNSTTILKWETDKADPPVKTVRAISEYYGIDMSDLVHIDLSIDRPNRDAQLNRIMAYMKKLTPDQKQAIIDLAELFAKQNSTLEGGSDD